MDWSNNDTGSLILEARAGTGKSSTLLALVNNIIKNHMGTNRIFIGAYNRAIADEFSSKLLKAGIDWKTAQCNTLHGAGNGVWRKMATKCAKEPDGKKISKLLEETITTQQQKDRVEPVKSIILKAVSFAKQRALGVDLNNIDVVEQWDSIIDHFGLDEDAPEDTDWGYVIKCAIWLYKKSLAKCWDVIDHDDMILAPLYHRARFWTYDWVLIDEAQDLNRARRLLSLRLRKETGRLVAVGDRHQAIYGFTGADADALDLVQGATKAKILPLTTTYRCPKSVVARAQRFVPDIEAHCDAPEGVTRSIFLEPAREGESPRNSVHDEVFTKEDAILCRNTKPLVELAYDLLKRGVPCRMEGRNIGEGLIALVTRWKVTNIQAMIGKLITWRDREMAKWLAKDREEKAEEVNDRAETIISLAQHLLQEDKTTVKQMVEFIDNLFGNLKPGERPNVLTLSTVHKAKGKEWRRVFLLGASKYMPSKWARKQWTIEQEQNLIYVALTRVMFVRDRMTGEIVHQGELVDIIVED